MTHQLGSKIQYLRINTLASHSGLTKLPLAFPDQIISFLPQSSLCIPSWGHGLGDSESYLSEKSQCRESVQEEMRIGHSS